MAPGPLVTPYWLRDHLDDPQVRVVDCRYVLGQPGAGRDRYVEAHIPGAAHLDLDEDLSAPPGNASHGRHPLPSAEAFGDAARRAGIGTTSTVVAYDEDMSGGAARLWWLLRHFGHDDVAVLDGGFDAWSGPTSSGVEEPVPGDFTPRPRDGDTVTAEQLVAALDATPPLLLDARAPERYAGEVEPIDPVAGHIPGARNVPYTEPLPAALAEQPGEIVAYCGSGVTAAVVLLRLAAAGREDAKLYPGSWSEWSRRGLPVERST